MLRVERWAAEDHLNCAGIVAALHGQCRPPEIPDRYVAALADAMLVGARASAPHVIRLPELRHCGNLADVAGGSGGYSIGLCRLRENTRATIYDRPAMLEHAAAAVDEAGLSSQIDLGPWDLRFEAIPTGHDAALVSHVLHLLDREARHDLLKRVRAALPRDGVLVIHDFVYEDPTLFSSLAASAVDWLSYGTGFTPTYETLTAELTESGFTVSQIVPIASTDTTLVVGLCV